VALLDHLVGDRGEEPAVFGFAQNPTLHSLGAIIAQRLCE
jgi:hypothetical protein